ncbi:MerR family transcriptional regulator [Kitasatospora sp. NPDC093550]|uniref:MerR family transcriptional regulator n=1 Tax=Kitasatospora sp. NPDC093550 TaxID=3364089 RepID=UPI003821B953
MLGGLGLGHPARCAPTRKGLLAPERRPSGYRGYGERDAGTVHGIRTLLAAGLNSAAIAAILPGLPLPGAAHPDRPAPSCSRAPPGNAPGPPGRWRNSPQPVPWWTPS